MTNQNIPAPDRYGYVCLLLPDAKNTMWYNWSLCRPEELTYLDIDQEADQ